MTDYTKDLHPQVRHRVRTTLHPIDVAQHMQLRLVPAVEDWDAPWRVYVADELWHDFGGSLRRASLEPLTRHWCGAPPLDVFVLPRRRERLAFHHLADPAWIYPGDMATRGWADCYVRPRARVVLLADRSETAPSLLWLLVHEATHVAVNAQGWLPHALGSLEPEEDPADATAHNELMEEQVCNGAATRALGQDYGRAWWQGRLALQKAFAGA